MIPLPMQTVGRATLAFVVSAGALALGSPSTARAGTYTTRYCQAGTALQDFSPTRIGVTGSTTDGCATGGGIRVKLDPATGTGAQLINYELTPPSAIAPAFLRIRGSLQFNVPGGDGLYGGVPYGTCDSNVTNSGCASGQVKQLVVDREIAPQERVEMAMFLACRPSFNPCGGSSGQLDVTQFDVTWRDDAPPVGSANLDVVAPSSEGTPVSGARTLRYSVGDPNGSGVKRVEVRIDGQVVAASPDQCAEPYVRMQPCSTGAIGELSVDTARVPDGTHEVKVVGIDVAGNEGPIGSATTVIQNGTNVGPGGDLGLRGAVNGSYAADDAKLTAWWPSTGRAPSKSRAVQKKCKTSTSYRRRHKVACRGRAPLSDLRVGYSRKKSNLVRGRLAAPTGLPVSNATVRVVAAPAAAGTAPAVVATAVTGADGQFKTAVPVALGSATYSVQWFARARDTQPAAVSKLSRAVRATTSISATPGRVVYRRQQIMFSGKLTGATGTPKGTAIVMQVNAGNGWRALTTVRARPSGRWTARYRVLPQLRGSYRFRAVVRPSAAYAYASGASRVLPIRIR